MRLYVYVFTWEQIISKSKYKFAVTLRSFKSSLYLSIQDMKNDIPQKKSIPCNSEIIILISYHLYNLFNKNRPWIL